MASEMGIMKPKWPREITRADRRLISMVHFLCFVYPFCWKQPYEALYCRMYARYLLPGFFDPGGNGAFDWTGVLN